MEEIKKVLLEWLLAEGIINRIDIVKFRKPKHGSCCTCQLCGYGNDECVCVNNRLLESVEELVIKISDLMSKIMYDKNESYSKGYRSAIEEVIATLERQQ